MHEVIINQDTRLGHAFDVALLWAIVVSVLLIMMESVQEINDQFYYVFAVTEWFFTILFTVEYLLRIFVSVMTLSTALTSPVQSL